MKEPRIHCDCSLAAGEWVDLCDERHHYLANVLRLAVNSPVRLFNGDAEFLCRVLSVGRHVSRIVCERAVTPLPVSRLQATLYVSLAKGRSMDLTMQKATELGVMSVQPVLAARSVRMSESWKYKLQHWRGIARSACEQCGRADLPQIGEPVLLERIEVPRGVVAFVLDPDSGHSLATAARAVPDARVAALIGPEGGLTDEEVGVARDKGFLPVSLGPRLLRVETAVTAALSVLQTFLGDFLDEDS